MLLDESFGKRVAKTNKLILYLFSEWVKQRTAIEKREIYLYATQFDKFTTICVALLERLKDTKKFSFRTGYVIRTGIHGPAPTLMVREGIVSFNNCQISQSNIADNEGPHFQEKSNDTTQEDNEQILKNVLDEIDDSGEKEVRGSKYTYAIKILLGLPHFLELPANYILLKASSTRAKNQTNIYSSRDRTKIYSATLDEMMIKLINDPKLLKNPSKESIDDLEVTEREVIDSICHIMGNLDGSDIRMLGTHIKLGDGPNETYKGIKTNATRWETKSRNVVEYLMGLATIPDISKNSKKIKKEALLALQCADEMERKAFKNKKAYEKAYKMLYDKVKSDSIIKSAIDELFEPPSEIWGKDVIKKYKEMCIKRIAFSNLLLGILYLCDDHVKIDKEKKEVKKLIEAHEILMNNTDFDLPQLETEKYEIDKILCGLKDNFNELCEWMSGLFKEINIKYPFQ